MEAETERRMGTAMTDEEHQRLCADLRRCKSSWLEDVADELERLAKENHILKLGMEAWPEILKDRDDRLAALAQSDAEPFDIDRDGIYDTDKGPPTYAEPVAWQLVPKNPTEKMLGAAANASDDDDWSSAMAKAYKAMLAVAPTPPRPDTSAGLTEGVEGKCPVCASWVKLRARTADRSEK